MHNFNKYSVPNNFNKISPIDSKFDTLNKFYKDFKTLNAVKSQIRIQSEKKTVLKSASLLYNELINIYKK